MSPLGRAWRQACPRWVHVPGAEPTAAMEGGGTGLFFVTQPIPSCPVCQGLVLPTPIRVRVRVQDNLFLIPVPHR